MNVEPSKVTVVIGADIPEAFIQLDIKRGKQGQPLAIQILLDGLSLEAVKAKKMIPKSLLLILYLLVS